MNTQYNKIEKTWSIPGKETKNNYCGLGEAILKKLKEDDPKRVLEVFYDKGIQLTVADVRRQTITVALNLKRVGVKKGDTIVLYSMSNEKVTPITFACYTIGAPINFFETSLEGDDISHILKQIDPTIIIFENKYQRRLYSALESLNLKSLKFVLSLDSSTTSPSVDNVLFVECVNIDSYQPPAIEDPTNHPATLMLTSGTTGLPKIIMHSHAVMMESLFAWWNIESGDKVFCFSPLRWISTVSIMLQPVFLDVQRIFTSQEPSAILGKQIIDTCKITHFFTVPAMYSAILDEAESDVSCSLNSLKIALVGGEVVTDALLNRMSKTIPHCKALHSYGMTELCVLVASDEAIQKKNNAVNAMALKKGFMAKIIDDNNIPLGPNEMGQLCVKRSSLPFLKYLRNDKANRENFLEGGWLNTGDYGFMDSDNMLHIVTRYKDLVRSGGNIIIPNTVEKNVGSHPSVLVAVLVGHPNPDEPNDEIATVFVVLRSGISSKSIEDELRDHMKVKCTKEEANAVRHIKVISEMPQTSCGKIDRNALKKMAELLNSN